MRKINLSLVRRSLIDQCGQVLPIVALGMVGFMAMGGLTLDVGRAYVARSQAQGAVNAAALAGVRGLSAGDPDSAISYAKLNEAKNPLTQWGDVTAPDPLVNCVDAMMPTGQYCATSTIKNAIKVTESVSIPTYFMKLVGIPSLTVGASAAASPGEAEPWIVELVVDTTPSMKNTDTNCGSNKTSLQCALIGIQGLLGKTNPCSFTDPGCSAANSNVRFGLMTFPNVKTSETTYNYGANCPSTQTNFQVYSLPKIPVSGDTASYTPITDSGTNVTYQPTYGAKDDLANPDSNGFYTNYYSTSTTTGNLNTSSSLVQSIGYTGTTSSKNPCLKLPGGTTPSAPGGGETAFAPVLYAAETALLAEKHAFPKVNGVPTRTAIIFLSDGQANALSQMFPKAGDAVSANAMNTGLKSIMNDALLGDGSRANPYKTPTKVIGEYPSALDACQQAIAAAKHADDLNIRVYSVAYGAENGGCLLYDQNAGTILKGKGTDVSPLLNLGALNPGFQSILNLVPCGTMANIASSPAYFYSDFSQDTGKGTTGIEGVDGNCTSPSNPKVKTLNDIFQEIYGSLTGARLIPTDLFPTT